MDRRDAVGKPERERLARRIGEKEERKLRSQRKGMRSVWSGLGMSGLIGWSVAIPTLLGILIGLWLDTRFPSGYSWTLMLLAAGLVAGCVNAWHWVSREDKDMHRKEGGDE